MNTLATINNILIISIIVIIIAIIYLFSEILCYLKIYRNLIDEERILPNGKIRKSYKKRF